MNAFCADGLRVRPTRVGLVILRGLSNLSSGGEAAAARSRFARALKLLGDEVDVTILLCTLNTGDDGVRCANYGAISCMRLHDGLRWVVMERLRKLRVTQRALATVMEDNVIKTLDQDFWNEDVGRAQSADHYMKVWCDKGP